MSRIMVCGTRGAMTQDQCWTVREALEGEADEMDALVVGDCSTGADALALTWARGRGMPVDQFFADWKAYGSPAGPIRNQIMVREGKPDECIAFWNGRSPGTLDAIKQCVRAGVPVRIFPLANAAAEPNTTQGDMAPTTVSVNDSPAQGTKPDTGEQP